MQAMAGIVGVIHWFRGSPAAGGPNSFGFASKDEKAESYNMWLKMKTAAMEWGQGTPFSTWFDNTIAMGHATPMLNTIGLKAKGYLGRAGGWMSRLGMGGMVAPQTTGAGHMPGLFDIAQWFMNGGFNGMGMPGWVSTAGALGQNLYSQFRMRQQLQGYNPSERMIGLDPNSREGHAQTVRSGRQNEIVKLTRDLLAAENQGNALLQQLVNKKTVEIDAANFQ